jgi:hypothetical protein
MTTEFIEYAGDEQYGTAFLHSHTLPKGDALWKRNGVEMTKDVVWERDPSVPIGQKGAKMRVLVKDLPPDAVKVLEATPGYKRVTV